RRCLILLLLIGVAPRLHRSLIGRCGGRCAGAAVRIGHRSGRASCRRRLALDRIRPVTRARDRGGLCSGVG
ncbi:hypothetical protein, partial [Acinetobacter baumannii]|uniref:hypothetical protein n=1 Tax=Acinetobacter baumannii TaxID=470 RepID=UPI0013CFB238